MNWRQARFAAIETVETGADFQKNAFFNAEGRTYKTSRNAGFTKSMVR